jgi:NAD+ synthase
VEEVKMRHAPEIEFSTEQKRIVKLLGVQAEVDPAQEIYRRTDFLCSLLIASKRKCFVLGISGGVDSLVAGFLCQRSVERARSQGYDAKFIAMRLPYGEQRDEQDAQSSLRFIKPDEILTLDIKAASDASLQALKQAGTSFDDAQQEDFILGNIKARQRMIMQYAVAGRYSGLVIGTDQAAEALMGFFTKHGDGACDVTPLTGLNKRQVRLLAAHGGADNGLVFKVPTADLETLIPLKPDELAFGVSYKEIDDFLENKPINAKAYQTIFAQFYATEHKRVLPITPTINQVDV